MNGIIRAYFANGNYRKHTKAQDEMLYSPPLASVCHVTRYAACAYSLRISRHSQLISSPSRGSGPAPAEPNDMTRADARRSRAVLGSLHWLKERAELPFREGSSALDGTVSAMRSLLHPLSPKNIEGREDMKTKTE